MAAETTALVKRGVRKALRWARLFALGLLTLAVLFLLSAWIGAAIPRNTDWIEPDAGVTIMVETNGIHTALVLPLVTTVKDWRIDLPASDLPAPDREYTHVSVSWGEREVFLNTPQWTDLSPITAFRVATLGGDSLLHVAHYVRPMPSMTARPLRLTEEQYHSLVRRIEEALPAPAGRIIYPGYTDYDVFYDARGRYTLANTCNQWTSDTLAASGVKTGSWTPFAGGVMRWVPEP